jgi:hypothetical protein
MGGKTTINAPKPDFGPMLKVIEQMRADQAMAARESAKAQERALAESQDAAAQLAMKQTGDAAMQDLMRQQQYQQAIDEAAKQQQVAETSTAGRDIVGPAFDVNAVNQAKMAGLATVAPQYTATPANYLSLGFDSASQYSQKPKKTLNKFTLPQQNLEGDM